MKENPSYFSFNDARTFIMKHREMIKRAKNDE